LHAHVNCIDKVIRGKAKAMIVKINRGSIERPPMPEIETTSNASQQDKENEETDEEKMERLITKGVEGDMDEINELENRVLRGKIKAAVIKAKRASK
tara:strand:+ start:22 stop:312 length:291 start_codon:yes stop_codon:yes gene_type:complete